MRKLGLESELVSGQRMWRHHQFAPMVTTDMRLMHARLTVTTGLTIFGKEFLLAQGRGSVVSTAAVASMVEVGMGTVTDSVVATDSEIAENSTAKADGAVTVDSAARALCAEVADSTVSHLRMEAEGSMEAATAEASTVVGDLTAAGPTEGAAGSSSSSFLSQ